MKLRLRWRGSCAATAANNRGRHVIARVTLVSLLAIASCAAPTPSDLLVPQDGVHLTGAASAVVPASPGGRCIVDTKASHLAFYTTLAGTTARSSLSMSVSGYHGTGTYSVTTRTSGAPLPSPGQEVFVAMIIPGAEWIANSGSVTVLAVAGDGSIRGTVNVPKAWSKGAGLNSTSSSSMQGTWTCKVQPVPSPVVANG
jgi:hypothetical protein